MAARGLVLAAPASGAGKTVVTLGLLRALRLRGADVTGAKSGPDYIDPAYHAAATGRPATNLDAWAMDAATLRGRAAEAPGDLLIVEGAMGVLDGAGIAGRGSVADLAQTLGVPLVLVVDAGRQAQSVALAVAGLRALRPELVVAGVILNRVASPRHRAMAEAGLAVTGVRCLGAVARDQALALPERHLGLVQAGEHADLAAFLDAAARGIGADCDLDALTAAAAPLTREAVTMAPIRRLPPPGQRIAVARDVAFAFAYAHMLADWQAAGAEILPFSPLADEGPAQGADAVFLPGGYPELHAATLAAAARFRAGMASAAARGALVYGECGGYMVLGDALIDAHGRAHRMLGLLPVTTSFANRRLSLGYRLLETLTRGAPFAGALSGHEFHYATIVSQGAADPLFAARDADGAPLAPLGLSRNRICGSFAHVVGPTP